MGLEVKTTAHVGNESAEGKLHLDSKLLSFRSKSLKWSLELGPKVRAVADGPWLVVSAGRNKARFQIEKGIDRWIDKILHPPVLLQKLGVKAGMKCRVSGGFARSFVEELKNAGCSRTTCIEKCDLVFWMIEHRGSIGELEEALEQLVPGINIWVVWPKGSKAITQTDVMTAVRRAGYGPSKTAAFSETLSSMRFARKKGS